LLLGRRSHLGFAASVLSGIVGAAIGDAIVWAIEGQVQLRHLPFAIIAAILCTLIVLLIANALTKAPTKSAAELITDGESDSVEFKSAARYNSHTKERDPRIELVIAKTVAGMANSQGGVLLIGVNDDGQPVGLDNDFRFMKEPDVDRYELWLRDMLGTTLGSANSAAVRAEFPTVSGEQICLVRIPRSDRPVLLTPGKGKDPELWVRIGNSTRQLPLDQAFAYSAKHWSNRALRRA